jgi:hypothetical protein
MPQPQRPASVAIEAPFRALQLQFLRGLEKMRLVENAEPPHRLGLDPRA